MDDIDPYYKKTITYPYRAEKLSFRVAQDLFSSQNVDVGTQRLLRSLIDSRYDAYRKVLDLGCGYGPIGVTLEKVELGRTVQMVDRDALALKYACENARINHVSDQNIYGSLGYS